MKNLPAPIAAFIEGAQPMAIATTAVPVVGGFAAAKLGGALAKLIPPVEDFASGGRYQDALVDLGGGLVVDAGVTAGVYLATGSAANAAKVAGFMAVGTVLGAAQPLISDAITEGVEVITSKIAELIGGTPPAGLADFDQMAPAGLADFSPQLQLAAPGGLEDFAPGGASDPYGSAAYG